jgi:undecaprenyl diphosphate synthase
MSLKEKIDIQRLPRHIAIIMDGNGRWAQKQGKLRVFGHESGVTSVRETAEAAAELGVEFLTLYAFSTENWTRPKYEVDALMHLLVQTLNLETATLNDNNIRLLAIGDLDSLPADCLQGLHEAMEKTKHNTRMSMVLALSYSARWEIMKAIRRIGDEIQQGLLRADDLSNELLSSYLSTAGMPDPELLIRTSGEYRISNFMLWQIAYTELYFTPKLWPDFRKEDLYAAILDYQCRERRFGKTSAQLDNNSNPE